MLTIRLTRKGKKNQPFFRVVVIDKRRSAKGGRAVEILGYVDPLTKRKSLKKERILYWISKGAQPSPTIHNLLVSEKIIDAKKINKSKKPKKKTELAVPAQVTAPIEVAPVTETSAPDMQKVEQPTQNLPTAELDLPAQAGKTAEISKEELKIKPEKPAVL